jgi:hypothetical protein
MKIQIKKWGIFIAAAIVLIGFAYAQTAKPGAVKTVKLETGEEVADLNGEWDVLIEIYGQAFYTPRGTYRNVIKIIQEDRLIKAIRLQDDSGAKNNRQKGSMFMQGELDKSGFKRVYYVDVSARLLPCTGQISEDGDTIKIDEGFLVRATLTRK